MDNIDIATAHDLSEDRSKAAELPLAIDSPLGPGALLMTRLDGEDALSRCFLYRVEVVATVPEASVEALLGEPVTLWMTDDSAESRRPIHGHVRSVAGLGRDIHGHRQFELEVVPRLWFLSCTCDCRIFQHLSVPEILREVFIEQGLNNFAFRVLQDGYPKLDYCVQYEESALDFVSRLMEHLGIFYWHEHSADKHVLVIGDRNAATGRCAPDTVSLAPNRVGGEIQTLDFRSNFRPGKWTLNDYDFESPTKRLLVDTPTTLNVPRMLNHEIYRWAGEFTQYDSGRQLSRLRMEMEEAQHRVVSGTGHCIGFDPGQRVGIDAGKSSLSDTYLLTEVRHHAAGPGIESRAGTVGYSYTNEFVAILAATPYRPPLVTPKPVMRGSQTATIVGPPGESIHCDAYGRVKVQFHWDRRGERNDRSSCWIRVAQSRAGSFYGNQVMPHVGHEVIVAYLDGDPDRPLIVGSVPNALTMPPVELPLDKHKTIQRDHADNRMIMQGKPGQEHLSLVSPRRIGMFATPHGARPLSAYGVPTNWTDGIDQFHGFKIDEFKDPDGLREVWDGWFLLCNPTGTAAAGSTGDPDSNLQTDLKNDEGSILKINVPTTSSSPPPSPPPPSSFTGNPSTGLDMKVDACDISSFTTGRNNAVSLGNKNTWVYADNNTWVHGNSNSDVTGDADSTVHGHSTSTIKSGSSSWIYDDAISGVFGDRTTFTIGTSQTATLGANIGLVLGANMTVRVGFTSTINFAVYWDSKGVKLQDAITKMMTTVLANESTMAKLWDDVTVLWNMEIGVIKSDLAIHM